MKVIIFGCGSSFKKALYETKISSILDIVAVVDNDRNKWGLEVEGYRIQPPHAIGTIEYDKIIITSVYWNEIKKQLIEECQVLEKEIISISDIIIPNERNIGSIRINGDANKGYTIDYLLENNMIQVSNDLEKFFFFGNHRLVHKWWHYFEVYEQYFSKFRKRKIKMLEIGVSQGGSLQMWKSYFADGSEITGIDIKEKCKEYEEDNIHVCIGSQNDEKFLKMVAEEYGPFDICFLQALFGQSCKTFLDIVACPNWTKLQSIWLALNRPAEQPCRHYELFTIRGTETVVLSLYPHVHVF